MDKASMKVCFASVVSEIKQSPIFLTVKARLFETPRANLNGARVTPAFLDEIVNNQEKYVGLPLNADVKALANGNYNRLGHLYDARTGEFHSTQIGSFYKFEKEDFEDGSYLIGYARIQKRNKAICKAIGELFADGSLNFSFEITCGSYEELDDGTIRIDAAEDNFLEGMAIVSFPACEDATALELVAELTDTNGKGDTEMNDVKEIAETVNEEQVAETVKETSAETVEVAEEAKAEEVQSEETACKDKKCSEDETACDDKECSEEENACKDKKCSEQENAAVYVTQTHRESVETYAYDTDSDSSVEKVVMVQETVRTREDDNLYAEQESVIAEDDAPAVTPEVVEESETTEADPAEGANTDACETKKTAEQLLAEQVAKLAEIVKSLQSEIAEMKESQKAIASAKKENATMNPFIAEITTEGSKEYELLKPVKNENTSYSLLSRAF